MQVSLPSLQPKSVMLLWLQLSLQLKGSDPLVQGPRITKGVPIKYME